MFRFITRQHFLVNLLVAALLVFAILFAVLWGLGFITRHGQFEKVPAVSGKTVNEATRLLEAKGFTVEVQDSLWDENLPPLSVIKQMPEAEQMVKAKRTIYLSINRSAPPMVEIPNFVGLSFRNAELYLKQLGLKLGDTLRRPDIAKDAVLQQLYNGVDIRPGTKIYQGSSVGLVLGSGLGEMEMDVPLIVGMTYASAKSYLQGMGLNFGALIVDGDVKDTANAYIYKQSPDLRQQLPDGSMKKNKMRPGQSLDIWIGTTKVEPPAADSVALEEPEN